MIWTRQAPFHVLRGAAIGTAEVLPGISGGTVMMIVGIYQHLIRSAGHAVGALRALPTDRARARAEFAQVRVDIVVPVILGMIPALAIGASVIAPLVESEPVLSFAAFSGMSLAATLAPITLVGRAWNVRWVLLAAAVAVLSFLLFGLPPQNLEPSLPVAFLAAAVAVCALALPGLSGSFLLLTIGLYQPTLDAASQRDLGYLAVFGLGAVLGLSLFVRALQRLLERHQVPTLVVVTGLMVGALRALWPWQSDETRSLLAPTQQVPEAVVFFVLGALVVLAVAWFGGRRTVGDEGRPA